MPVGILEGSTFCISDELGDIATPVAGLFAQDTRFLLQLKDQLAGELDRMGRTAWAKEEFSLLEGTRWQDETPGTAYLRVKGARHSTRRQRSRPLRRDQFPNRRECLYEQRSAAGEWYEGRSPLYSEARRASPRSTQERRSTHLDYPLATS